MSENKEVSIEDVINKIKEHRKKINTKLIMKAYEYADTNHKDQVRKSGEKYIIHPLHVAYILADMGLDDSTICAALLHDVVEDTTATENDIKTKLGKISGIVKVPVQNLIDFNLKGRNVTGTFAPSF